MNSEESYLDSLLRNILNPEAEEPRKEESQIDTVAEEQAIQEPTLKRTEKMEPVIEHSQLLDTSENLVEEKETSVPKTVTDTLEETLTPEGITNITEEALIPEEMTKLSEKTYSLEEPLLSIEESENTEESTISEKIQFPKETIDFSEESPIIEGMADLSGEPLISEELQMPEEITDISEESLLQMSDISEEPLEQQSENLLDSLEEPLIPEESSLSEEIPESTEDSPQLEEITDLPEEPSVLEEPLEQQSENLLDSLEEPLISEESLISEEMQTPDFSEEPLLQIPEDLQDILGETLLSEEIPENTEDSLQPEGTTDLLEEMIDIPDTSVLQLSDGLEEPLISDSSLLSEEPNDISDETSILDLATDSTNTDVIEPAEGLTTAVETNAEESALTTAGTSDSGGEFSLEDKEMPESDDDLKLDDIEIPELSDLGIFEDNELNIDGLGNAIQSETEREMAGELNIDELGLDNEDLTMPMDFNISDFSMSDLETQDTEVLNDPGKNLDIDIPDIADVSENSDILSDNSESDTSINMDDNLEDVLNMLDDDAELAEINDMLKKSDNNEPIQDDMMDLLNQMADDEAASVNAGLNHSDEDDGGVPLPVIPQSVLEETQLEVKAESDEDKKTKKAAKKKKKVKETEDAEVESKKEPGKLGKFFNMLTEDLVPEPTEEELAAEKEAKKAKKQEEQAKKEEEKLAKDEEKKAKAEEKAAAKKAKQEEAAKKKQEKKAQKEAKKAKQAGNGANKRIPPKKLAAVAAFGASVGGAVLVATNVLSTQGFLQTARNAYYKQDYKTVYQATYGMELNGEDTESLIKKKSEIIYKIQRKYDSYQNNLKMGRELEALDALLQGLVVYDTVNAEAEVYEVTAEVDEIKSTICSILETKYHLDETQARTLLSNEDPLTYTIALNDVITQN